MERSILQEASQDLAVAGPAKSIVLARTMYYNVNHVLRNQVIQVTCRYSLVCESKPSDEVHSIVAFLYSLYDINNCIRPDLLLQRATYNVEQRDGRTRIPTFFLT